MLSCEPVNVIFLPYVAGDKTRQVCQSEVRGGAITSLMAEDYAEDQLSFF